MFSTRFISRQRALICAHGRVKRRATLALLFHFVDSVSARAPHFGVRFGRASQCGRRYFKCSLILFQRKSHFTLLINPLDSSMATTNQFHMLIWSGMNWVNICASKKFIRIIVITGPMINNAMSAIRANDSFNRLVVVI
jgi:hypothetical protein